MFNRRNPMLKISWTMNSGNTYISTMEGDSWEDVADFISDNDIINVDNGGQQVQLIVDNISEFMVEVV